MAFIDWNDRAKGHVRIAVDPNVWSESKKSWHILTIKQNDVWSQGVWFAKDKCILNPKGFITLPTWYYDTIFNRLEKPEILNFQ